MGVMGLVSGGRLVFVFYFVCISQCHVIVVW